MSNTAAATRDLRTAFRDMTDTVEDAVEFDDKVWLRVTAPGSNTGPFLGPPCGRRVGLKVIDIVRVLDGQIVEHWGVPDRFAVRAQTGVLDRLRPRV